MPALTPAEAIQIPDAAAHVSRINRDISTEWSAYDRAHGMTVALTGTTEVCAEVMDEYAAKGWDVVAVDGGLSLRPTVAPR